jgi:ferredoxin--NADP+ reductase
VYERFEVVVLAHGVRHVSDLGYRGYIEDELPSHELVGDEVRRKLRYYPSVTREAFRNQGRLTDLLATDKLPADLGLPPLDHARDRVMICGSPAMLADTVALLEARGFEEGSNDGQGHYVIEKAFAQR